MRVSYKNGVKKVLKATALVAALVAAGCGSGEKAEPTVSTPSVASPTAEPIDQQAFTWTDKDLLTADFTLYRVDCASQDTGSFPSGSSAGLCQSLSDMPYGEDPVTHTFWGYHKAAEILPEEDSLGEGITAFKWVVSKEASDPSKAEICYDFSVPEGNYTVTLGFYNPFGVRKINVECEGKTEIKSEKILRYNVNEKSFEAKVTDGTLNLKVFNPNANTFMESPILSYITIATDPEYTRELLSAAVEAMRTDNAAELYTESSAASYLSALEAAEKFLAKESNDGTNQIKQKFKNLRESYKMLTKKLKYDSFNPGAVWTDTEGTPIQAHGGQVQQLEIPDPATGKLVTKWVWVGEDKTNGYRGGVCAYTSDDLYNWQFEGVIMRNVPSRRALEKEEYFKSLYAGCTDAELDNVALALDAERAVIERPKLIYNEKNKQYVLWFHADGPTATSNSNYAAACAGVAVSDTPFGPYRFIGRYRLNTCPPDQEDKHPQSKGMARDMNLFKDTDGTAYIIYSSEENLTLYISKLNEDYTYLETAPEKAVYGKDFIRLFPGAQREAPALFLKDGKYYLMTSGCTGWAPNQARYYVSDSVMGEWTSKGDPCVGDVNHTTFESQSTCIFRDVNSGTWIYMGDRWFADTLNDSRYIWLPIVFKENGDMEISFVSNWKLQ
ncbi:MAG: glycoside hydrolase family 43 protein [Lachnospiraceae bacterium]|nr:glycoside hydrolase family 43 protein [Lachnospiraceae bacterium]